nr:glycosyltransferase family 2 protein [Paraburkholderia sp. BL8N3]
MPKLLSYVCRHQEGLSMKVSVLVPTYRRPTDLLKCLQALAMQEMPATEVLVVCRTDDQDTHDALELLPAPSRDLPIRVVSVTDGGQVAALNAGIAACACEIVCITDDDAMPHPDWIRRIVAHFEADPAIGGVGGLDRLHVGGRLLTGRHKQVGIVQASGRTVGNHHLGYGAPRCVDILKGANMSFRAEVVKAIGVDRRLKGTGAQVHNDLGLSLAVRRTGMKLLYDPLVQVDHYQAERFDEDSRTAPALIAHANSSYNLNLVLLDHFPGERGLKVWRWYRLVGTRDAPGLVQVVRMLLKGERGIFRRWHAVRQGAHAALRDVRGHGETMRRPSTAIHVERNH